MNSHQSILAKISILQKKMEVLRESEKKLVIAEIRKLIEMYGVRPAELFLDAGSRPATARKRGASGKRILSPKPPKYRDPATGKTWNGHGKRPFWLVGDKDAFLITAQDADSVSKPKTRARRKQATGKPGAAKATKKAAPAARAKKSSTAPKRAVKSRTAKKAAAPKTVSAPPPPKPATPPSDTTVA